MTERHRHKNPLSKHFNPYNLEHVARMDEFIDEWYEDLVRNLGKEPDDSNNPKEIEHRGILKIIDRNKPKGK